MSFQIDPEKTAMSPLSLSSIPLAVLFCLASSVAAAIC